MKSLTIGRALIITAGVLALIAFVRHWQPGMVLQFLREGEPLDRFVLLVFLVILLPPLVERLRLPGILGLILAGVVLGPSVLAVVPKSDAVATFFSGLGRVFLMFVVGLGINLAEFRKHAVASGIFGVATFLFPVAAGVGVGLAFGYSLNASVLIGSLLGSHTLLALPVLDKLGLLNARFALTTIGATIFTDIASLLVLAVCVSVHLSDTLSLTTLVSLLGSLAVYCVLVLGAIPWAGQAYLRRRAQDEAATFQFVMLAVLVCAIGAKLIQLEDIVGAFLCGIAINQVLGEGPAREKIEFLGKQFFIPGFFVVVGIGLDLQALAHSVSTQLPFVLAILGALFGAKLVAAIVAQTIARYTWTEGLGMWSLSLPQLAATLAAALTAHQTMNAASEALIDDTVITAVFVLMVVTAILGPILTQGFAQRIERKTNYLGFRTVRSRRQSHS